MSKYTPGPWRWGGDSYLLGAKDKIVLSVSNGGGGYSEWTGPDPASLEISNEADAGLIETAPDLYEALILVVGTLIGRVPDEQIVIQRAQLAIAKAEGRS